MFTFQFATLFAGFILISAKPFHLNQKELQAVGAALKSVVDQHVGDQHEITLSGSFKFTEFGENDDDFDISIDFDYSETHNGVLSGKLEKLYFTSSITKIRQKLKYINRKRCFKWTCKWKWK